MIDMKKRLTAFIGFALALGSADVRAAQAPLTQKQLESQSELIVTGKVMAIASRVQKSQIERSFGIHRDRIYTLTIQVLGIAKGSGVKVMQEIQVLAWRPVVRIPRLPGFQGHGPIPGKGDTVTVYLKWNKAGKFWAPIHPNGIEITKRGKRSS